MGSGVHPKSLPGCHTNVTIARWVEIKENWTVEGVKMIFVVYCHRKYRQGVTPALQGRGFGHFSSFVYQGNIERECGL